ncbi:MAG: hypothetical protein GXN93_03005 [Candidatus Diapherotrites archaeon]|nr:hypothetical protein [Candidatus Diapherotrites archaeon]
MDILRLPYGPWKPLISGKYEDYDISLYQNPDRDIFTVVVDKDEEGNPKGLVVIMYRAFLVDGDVNTLMNGLKERTTAIVKKRDSDLYRFLLIQEGPKYIGLQKSELADTLSKLGNALYADSTLLRKVAVAMGIPVTHIRDVPARVAALLLAEPIVIPNMLGHPGGISTTSEFGKVLPVGTGRDGSVEKESIFEFARTTILGEHERARKQMLAIIAENAMLTGIPTIILTQKPERYDKLNEPSPSNAVSKVGISPIGFPTTKWIPGEDLHIDLNTVDQKALAETLGITSEIKAYQAIVAAIRAKQGGAGKIGDLVAKDAKMKYHALQAFRICKHEDLAYGKYYGKNDVTPLLEAGDIGHATVIHVPDDPHAKTAVQSLLSGLLRFLENRGKSKKLRAMLIIDGGDHILPRLDSDIQKALVNTITELRNYGIGFAVDAPSEADIAKNLLDLAEAHVRTVSDEEVGIRIVTKRPYRAILRPLASNITL